MDKLAPALTVECLVIKKQTCAVFFNGVEQSEF